jgi:cytochrome c553
MDLNYYLGKKNTLKIFGIILWAVLFYPYVVVAADTISKEENSKMASEMKEDVLKVEMVTEDIADTAAAEHKSLFIESSYPSATTCATCHPKHFEEWSKSQHAYAQLSPVVSLMR